MQGWVPLTPTLFKGRLCIQWDQFYDSGSPEAFREGFPEKMAELAVEGVNEVQTEGKGLSGSKGPEVGVTVIHARRPLTAQSGTGWGPAPLLASSVHLDRLQPKLFPSLLLTELKVTGLS